MAALLLLSLACADDPHPEPLHTGPSDPAIPPVRPLGWSDVAGDTLTFARILAAEDRRASHRGDLDTLVEATTSPLPGIRRASARALGRLERPELVDRLLPLLEDPDPMVRVEVASALAQAVHRADGSNRGVEELRSAILRRLTGVPGEEESGVRGALFRSVGRLPLADTATSLRISDLLVELSLAPGDLPGAREDVDVEQLLGMVMGAYQLQRRAQIAGLPTSQAFRDRLETLATRGAGVPLPDAVRRTAVLARLAAGPPSEALVGTLLRDADPGVRRLAAGALPSLPESPSRREWLAVALSDPGAEVRIEAVRSWSRAVQDSGGCAPLRAATEDPSIHVAVVALDALGGPCPGEEEVPELLAALARELPPGEGRWHRPARALAALARVDGPRARGLLPAFSGHSDPFVRVWAARVAGAVEDRDLLRRLAGDPVPNVREASIAALFPLEGRRADSILVAQLEFDDPQLLMTTAALLEGAREGGPAVPALFRALGRLTAMEASTTRDARVPLLRRIGELGTFWQAAQIDPYLTDIDPLVAQEASRILEEWTGERIPPTPRGHPPLPLPAPGLLRELQEVRVEMEMDAGGVVVMRLLPFEAPTHAARFASLSRSGTFEGLTFHRVVPNFVVQGGSPNANEYAGHGAYTRDEVGLISHWQGTVGTSTRGHDTGDGQIFVNLVDNLRLDHDYTIFAEVVEGMDVVHGMQEGARIRAVRLVAPVTGGEG